MTLDGNKLLAVAEVSVEEFLCTTVPTTPADHKRARSSLWETESNAFLMSRYALLSYHLLNIIHTLNQLPVYAKQAYRKIKNSFHLVKHITSIIDTIMVSGTLSP